MSLAVQPDQTAAERDRPQATAARLICDVQRRVIVANGAAELLLGRSSVEMRGRPVESFGPEALQKAMAAELAVLTHGRPGAWGTVEIVHGESGDRVGLEVACRPAAEAGRYVVALRRAGGAPLLTDREREVFSRVADGMTGSEVARALFLSPATVERHVANCLRKLGAKNRAHGIAIALRTGALGRPGTERSGGSADGAEALHGLLVEMLEGLADPAAVLDERGEVLVVNEAWRAFGRANGRPDIQTEENYLAVCDRASGSDDARRAARGIRELLEDRSRSFTMEYRCDGLDGPRWYELRAARYRGAAPRAAVFVRHRDLTGQRRAESRAYIGESLMEGVDAVAVECTPEGIVTAWISGAQGMLGWAAEEAIGRPVWDLFLPRRERACGEAVLEEARRSGRWAGELELERQDGTVFPAQARVRSLVDADGNVTALMGVAVDITEQRRARSAVAESSARLAAFAEATRDGWISGDATGRITQVNAATEEMLGWSAADLVGRTVDAITAVPSPLRSLARPTRNGGPRQVREELLSTSDGRQVLIEYTTSRFSTGEGLEQWAIVFRPAARPGPDAPPTLGPADD